MKPPLVGIIMGSDSDLPVMKAAAEQLDVFGIPYELTIVSAHRTPERMYEYARTAMKRGIKVIIAGAGGSAHLPGMVSAITTLPVIGVPVLSKTMSGIDSLYSIVQMPPGIPTATVAINGAQNAGLLAAKILAIADEELLKKIEDYKNSLEKTVIKKAEKLEKLGYATYINTSEKDKKLAKSITDALPNVLKTIDLPSLGKKYQGKVRDIYIQDNKRILITTDRQSAFDVVLGYIPYKGTVLNQLSKFWFEKTKKIIQNHMIAVPDQNVMITKNCEPTSVEIIVRGYLTGVTKTSIWTSYEKGERIIYGIKFPNGMKKNQKLSQPIITPTTHPESSSGLHDERLTRDEIIRKKILSKQVYEQMEEAALSLFELGSKWCKKQGLILVDTKYEFGIYDGKLLLIDEIHTPDSSRFWIADTYNERFESGLEPENFDKEFLRLWYAEKGYRGDGKPPKMSEELVIALAKRYIGVYEKITGEIFESYKYPIEERVIRNISEYLG